jgi:transcription elongation factor Elf1
LKKKATTVKKTIEGSNKDDQTGVKLVPNGRKKYPKKMIHCPECGWPILMVAGVAVEKLMIEPVCPGCRKRIAMEEKLLNQNLEPKDDIHNDLTN